MSKRSDPVRDQLGYWAYARVRDRLMADQGGACFYCLLPVYRHYREAPDAASCRTQIATIDHIEPLSKGGTWKRYNLCIACKSCNTRKGSLSEEEFHELLMAEADQAPQSQENAA